MLGPNLDDRTNAQNVSPHSGRPLATAPASKHVAPEGSKQDFQFSPAELKRWFELYAANPLYSDCEEWLITDNPYRRPIRPRILKYLDFGKVLKVGEQLQYSALAAQRMLFNIYEADLMFLPPGGLTESTLADFRNFYSDENKLLGELIRPTLEKHVFGFLENEVHISGHWSAAALKEYLFAVQAAQQDEPSKTLQVIRTSSNPQDAGRVFLIQLGSDFLSEASPMARNVLGSFGSPQSELFKVLIDEYGYGVHATKHSALFEKTLQSAGLKSDIHAYWQFYLTSSMALSNYFHYVSRCHSRFFRYLGALYFVEATFAHICRQMAETLNEVFSGQLDVEYFREHIHIDRHHGRMVFDKILTPIIEQHGEFAIHEILRGFEEVQILQRLADEDFIEQIAWMDRSAYFKSLAPRVAEKLRRGELNFPAQVFVEPKHELSVTHVHDGDELCLIESGVMEFVTGHGRSTLLHAGEGTVIQRNRLHGAIIASEECRYHIISIGDYASCLS